MISEIENVLAVIRAHAARKGIDYSEYVEFCIYPDMVEEWIAEGLSCTSIKKRVDERFTAYNKQRKYLSSLV